VKVVVVVIVSFLIFTVTHTNILTLLMKYFMSQKRYGYYERENGYGVATIHLMEAGGLNLHNETVRSVQEASLLCGGRNAQVTYVLPGGS
jgi:hypothetical protein